MGGAAAAAISVLSAGCALLLQPAAALAQAATAAAEPMASFLVDGDAIVAPLTGIPGDAARGRAIVANRQMGLCLLCHAGPIPEERFQGNLAPDLAGAGARLSAGQLRLRIVDGRRLNPASIMPSYYRTDNLTRVSPALRGKPIFTAQQVEDVVAWLRTLDATAAPAAGMNASRTDMK